MFRFQMQFCNSKLYGASDLPISEVFTAPMFTSLTDGVNTDTKQLHRHKDTKLHETVVARKQANM
jgi:hypothetical protein